MPTFKIVAEFSPEEEATEQNVMAYMGLIVGELKKLSVPAIKVESITAIRED